MARKKKEEEVEETANAASETEATEETAVESKADTGAETTEDKPKKAKKKKADEAEGSDEPNVLESVIDTVSAAAETVAGAVVSGVSSVVSAVTGGAGETKKRTSTRAEKVGIVQSDKMTKTVTVRVDRLVKHPTYRKYVKRRKKFMAHDELGATVGDKVKIVETRPLSARKRWRVVEIIQKAEK